MSKIECRIIKNTLPSGREFYTIEQKKKMFFGGYKWKQATLWYDDCMRASYDTLEEAQKDFCWYDGTETKREVVSTPPTIVYEYLSTPPKK